ncbi:MAG: phage tail protein, partial [Cyanobacteria bacterium J06598_3]
DPSIEAIIAPDEPAGTLVGHKNIDLKIQPGGGYLDFLPEIYRSDFMERFMTIFEQAFDPTVQTTDTLWAYLDPLTAPKSLIAFLAQWVDWPLNPNWTLSRQRRLIKHAVELYRWRGTRKGLQLMLHLHTQLPWEKEESADVPQAIEIKESFDTGFVLGTAKLSENPRLGGGRPYFFTVTLRPRTIEQANSLDEALVRKVIEQEKPAFCNYHLDIERPREAAPTSKKAS